MHTVSARRVGSAGFDFRSCGNAEFLSFSRKRFWESRFCCLLLSARSASFIDLHFFELWFALDDLKVANSASEMLEPESDIEWSKL